MPQGTIVDLDAGDSLTFTATQTDLTPLPDWLSFDDENLIFSGTPDLDDGGILAVRLSGTDNDGASVSTDFDINVQIPDIAYNLSILDGDNGIRLDGVAANDRSGISVSGAGDVNGDGFDDLIVGAVGASPQRLSIRFQLRGVRQGQRVSNQSQSRQPGWQQWLSPGRRGSR